MFGRRRGGLLAAIPEVEPVLFEPDFAGGGGDALAVLAGPAGLALIEPGDEAALRRDTEKALHALKPGGVLAWRGYLESAEVNRYLNALRHKLPLVRLAGTGLVVSRLPASLTSPR